MAIFSEVPIMCSAINDSFLTRPINIISGLPRSGTSMMMHILSSGGMKILTDNVRKRDSRNFYGYFEFEDTKKPHTYYNWMNNAQGKVVKIISRFIPYLPPNNIYRVIFIHRNLDAIISSQKDMAIHYSNNTWTNGTEINLLEQYNNHINSVINWINSRPNIELLELQYEQIVSNSPDEITKIIKFLKNKNLDTDKMNLAINPELNHHKEVYYYE